MSARRIRLTEPTLPPLSEFDEGLRAIWRSRQLSNDGRYARQLATKLGALTGTPTVTTASGTDALTVALIALGVKGEVIVPSLTFVATAQAVLAAGARPVIADVDPESGLLTPRSAQAHVSSATEAVVPVHLFGAPCDAAEWERFARRQGLALVFDAAHGLCARYADGRVVGSAGDAEAFSLHATKVLAAGEGGALACPSDELATRCRAITRFGMNEDGVAELRGINSKLAELPALLALRGLDRLKSHIAHRTACVQRYRSRLASVHGLSWLPNDPETITSPAFAPVLINPDRLGLTADELHDALLAEGVETRRYFSPPLHMHPAFASSASDTLPAAEHLAARILCIPLSSHLSFDDLDLVVSAIVRLHSWCRERSTDRTIAIRVGR